MKERLIKKDHISLCNLSKKNRRGQVTIFIIIAIIIVAAALIIYSFFPKVKTSLGIQQNNPEGYIQSCLQDKITSTVNNISEQGGSLVPKNFVLYNNTEIEFLCYTEEYYRPCVLQQPMLKEYVQSEIENGINSDINSCFSSMQQSFEGQGYAVDLTQGAKTVELLPNKIVATFNYSATLTKGTDIQKYNSFSVILNNNLYELTTTATSILNFESVYGDAETTTYMTYYHHLKVEKIFGINGAKIYILTNRDTGDKFQFATRGQVLPGGYTTS